MVRTRRKGFTLIELIIAITILALLAVALLAALDPVEQFNKARDTATRDVAQELAGAIGRYYAAQEKYPGTVTTGNATDPGFPGEGIITDASRMLTAGPTTTANAIITALVNSGELKSNFMNAGKAGLDKLLLINDKVAGTGVQGVFLCYQPTSKQFITQAGLYQKLTSLFAQTNVALANGMFADIIVGGTGTCNVATPGNTTNRDNCAFCIQL